MSAMRRSPGGSPACAGESRAAIKIEATARAGPVTLRWEVSAAALRAARPDLPVPAGAAFVRLEWRVPGAMRAGLEARAELVDAAGGRLALAAVAPAPDDLAGPITWTHDGDLSHVDIDGLLYATVRWAPSGEAAVLYARTTLLERLGLAGGRYEVLREEAASRDA